ncbi:MAG: Uncharacterized protein JWN03_8334 [Nocardia sp.]|uniref:hypothetical protein n=1 Tax=Nocardia sp. TaxID=1821 RepID=UPI00262334C2|nr:hypothetical protein [Nocardia sp.]MCU1648059.1 Uncharacterized protein [Nocardia sp.]
MGIRPAMFGYLRQELVEGRIDDVQRHIRAFADGEGFDVAQIFCERGSHTGALWALISSVEQATSAHVVVPARTHLEGVSRPRSALLQRLSLLNVQVWHLNLADDAARAEDRRRSGRTDVTASSVVGQFGFPVGAAEPVVLLHVHEYLTRAGLRGMVRSAESVVVTIAREAVAATRPPVAVDTPIYRQLGAELNQLTVRIVLRSDALLIQIHETREYADEPVSTALAGFGEAGRVPANGGGTFTWCELPLVEGLHSALHRREHR